MWQYYIETIIGVFRRNQSRSERIRNHHEASGRFRKHQTGQGDQPWLEGRLYSKSRRNRDIKLNCLGRETRVRRETSLGFEGRLYRKSSRDRDIKLNRGISLGWEVAPPGRADWAGRAGWAGRPASDGRTGCAGRAGWVSHTQKDAFIISTQLPPSPLSTFMILTDPSWCFFVASWPILTSFAYYFSVSVKDCHN